jgi:hypothetical protein
MIRIPKSAAPWICLGGTLILFLLYLAWLHPTNWFGAYRDDEAYFSSAKCLAEGRGYVIPNLPGDPPQTKYPVLYPWLLSWVWKWNPSFPSNLGPGVCLTAFFSCWFLVVAFQLLRKLHGVGDWPALVIVFLCALDSHFLLFSGFLMSDVPFMALALASALAADNVMRAGSRYAPAVLVGVVAGLSVMMRSVGVAVVAGIIAAALFRRAFRQAVAFCLGAAPFVGSGVWAVCRSLMDNRGGSASGVASTLAGWQQALFYSTSYLKMWRLCVPNLQVFWAMLRINLKAAILAPAAYWLFPTLNIGESLAANTLGAVVGAFSLAGILRQARRQEWKPLHYILAFYLAVIVLWNYSIMWRLLLPFLPLFLVGLWVEAKHLTDLALTKLRSADPVLERLLAATLVAGLGTLTGIAAWNFAVGHRPELVALGREQNLINQEKLQVYGWIRQQSAPGAVIVAYRDASVYLYTGRKAVMPIAFSTEYIYTHDQRVLDRDLAHMTDVACAVGAGYWLTSEDDFNKESQVVEAREQVARLMSGLPEVSRSQAGRVRLYDISSLFQPRRATCPAGRLEPGENMDGGKETSR